MSEHNRLPPQDEFPYRLCGLWNPMERLKGSETAQLMQGLWALSIVTTTDVTEWANWVTPVSRFKALCDRLGLRLTSSRLSDLRAMLKGGDNLDEKSLRQLGRVYREELESKAFFYIPAERVVFYQLERPFGDAVFDAFPSTRYDCTEAGNCIAVNRPTACVFHCMRALEIVLRALARKHGVRKNVIWFESEQTIINELASRIKNRKMKLLANKKTKRASTNSKAKAAIEYDASLSARLESCKDAWRNSVAHAQSKYTEEEARRVYDVVGGLMQDAAKTVKESA